MYLYYSRLPYQAPLLKLASMLILPGTSIMMGNQGRSRGSITGLEVICCKCKCIARKYQNIVNENWVLDVLNFITFDVPPKCQLQALDDAPCEPSRACRWIRSKNGLSNWRSLCSRSYALVRVRLPVKSTISPTIAVVSSSIGALCRELTLCTDFTMSSITIIMWRTPDFDRIVQLANSWK